jgi:hypothetical protein
MTIKAEETKTAPGLADDPITGPVILPKSEETDVNTDDEEPDDDAG